ncbi:MAG: hypothetical protein AAFX93_14135 [Verrucomicrobiota bacterium]
MIRIFILGLVLVLGAACTDPQPPIPAPVTGEISVVREIELTENLALAYKADPETDPSTILPEGLKPSVESRIINQAKSIARIE